MIKNTDTDIGYTRCCVYQNGRITSKIFVRDGVPQGVIQYSYNSSNQMISKKFISNTCVESYTYDYQENVSRKDDGCDDYFQTYIYDNMNSPYIQKDIEKLNYIQIITGYYEQVKLKLMLQVNMFIIQKIIQLKEFQLKVMF